MADIVLYNEEPRPYQQPPSLRWDLVESPEARDRLRSQVIDILDDLLLILKPLKDMLPILERHQNLDDLLRKLKWYTEILRPILDWGPDNSSKHNRFGSFDQALEKIVTIRKIQVNLDPKTGKMPVIPLLDLLVGVHFDIRHDARQ
ncbi:MAG: hypothetical protein Q9225_002942 [Loekoesia sp. 1 TL-2023]